MPTSKEQTIRGAIVISGPSGTGKGSLVTELLRRNPILEKPVNMTTRQPREYDVHGKNYYFVSDAEFDSNIARGAYIEWKNIHHFKYGTLWSEVARIQSVGHIPLFDIDPPGAIDLQKRWPTAVFLFFILPCPLTDDWRHELELRIRARQPHIDEFELATRLATAETEVALIDKFDAIVLNRAGMLDAAIDEIDRKIKEIILPKLT